MLLRPTYLPVLLQNYPLSANCLITTFPQFCISFVHHVFCLLLELFKFAFPVHSSINTDELKDASDPHDVLDVGDVNPTLYIVSLLHIVVFC